LEAMLNDRQSARPAPRLYLITPMVADPAAIGDQLDAALAATDTAAVLLRLATADERTLINRIKALASTAQAHDVALLVEGHPDLIARAGADGAHFAGSDALLAAIGKLKPERIAGAGRLPTRHDAMIVAEAGGDYVMFGDPDARGDRPSLVAIAERVAWWSELFEIPCVAYAERFGDMGELCAAGADFIAIGEPAFADPQGCAAALAQARAQVTA
jgi:thiamine-phosphate pyrophosphorylase